MSVKLGTRLSAALIVSFLALGLATYVIYGGGVLQSLVGVLGSVVVIAVFLLAGLAADALRNGRAKKQPEAS